jgi:nuclear protein localization family protein 4
LHALIHVQEKNEYGLEVMRQGRPMPCEYLLVDVPTATPVHQPLATFSVPREGTLPFPLENRGAAGESQAKKQKKN